MSKKPQIKPLHLNGMAALLTAQRTKLRKQKGERDTEFVKRIVAAYLEAHVEIEGWCAIR